MKPVLFSFRRIVSILFFLIAGAPVLIAKQAEDTVWVAHQEKVTYIKHLVQRGETLFMLSERFLAPAALTARLNEMNYSEGLPEGSIFKIPVGKFNYLQINSVVHSKPIYYQVQEGDRLRTISRYFNVAQSAIQRWNKLPLPEVFAGQVLQVGWVRFDKTKFPFVAEPAPSGKEKQQGNPNKELSAISKQADSLDGNNSDSTNYSKLFYQQNEGQELQEASGAAVFFTAKISENEEIYYAFFDDAPRGTILSIINPATRKVVYAKVIGPRPKIGKYQNALIGLSFNAAKALQGRGSRIFVKIKY